MAGEKSTILEREYIIPLRDKCRSVPRYKKTNKAIKSIKEFLAKHMKVTDRDLNKVKLDLAVNEAVWARGIKNPISKVKVKAVKEGDIVRVTLVELSKKAIAKKKMIEKREVVKAKEVKTKEKKIESEDKDKDGVNDKVEIKEMEKSNEIENAKVQKRMAKSNDKTTSEEKKKEQKQPQPDLAKA
jgi:large subunit ribosomal protein L31e